MDYRMRLELLVVCVSLLVRGVRLQEEVPSLQNEFPTKCIEDLGCFRTDGPYYHPVFRPLSLLPFDVENIPTRFVFFGLPDPRVPTLLEANQESLDSINFIPQLETKIIIHGFTGEPRKGDVNHIMKDVLFMCKNYNVIIVDWSESAKAPYPQAVANARVVGAQIVKLLDFLQQYAGLQPEKVHLIGHSLGAQVAGWAGERIPKLGRITGLDPAGPYFYQAPQAVRLEHTDALFVDIIHTNGGNSLLEGLGLEEPVGHLDFYPNGGQHQPGCMDEATYMVAMLNATDAMVPDPLTLEQTCSHARAITLFIASILSDSCRFESVPCDSADDFARGNCGGSPQMKRWKAVMPPVKYEMGLHARKPHLAPPGRKYFLKTTTESPYCEKDMLLNVPRPHHK